MKIINLTPHVVNIGERTFPTNGLVRVATNTVKVGELDGIPLFTTQFGEVENLPEEVEGTFLIVARMVAIAVEGRNDLLVPNGLVRNEQGQVVGASGFERI